MTVDDRGQATPRIVGTPSAWPPLVQDWPDGVRVGGKRPPPPPAAPSPTPPPPPPVDEVARWQQYGLDQIRGLADSGANVAESLARWLNAAGDTTYGRRLRDAGDLFDTIAAVYRTDNE